jgi:hypothetical protein
LSIYNNTAVDDERLVPAAPKPSVGKYKYAQCLTDPAKGGRALNGPTMRSDDMTNDMCVKFCLGNEMHHLG